MSSDHVWDARTANRDLSPAAWRKLLAGMAMQGFISSDQVLGNQVARLAVQHADALLAELERTKENDK